MVHPIRKIDQLLNGVTMYRLLLYGLSTFAFAGVLFAGTGVLSLSVGGMLASLAILLASCIGANWAMHRIWNIPSNSGSSTISALILFCILPPSTSFDHLLVYFLAGMLAMASKYLVAFRGKHLFNPAAFAAVLIGLFGIMHATWWVGNGPMLIFTLGLGLLIIRKLRRIQFFIMFALVSLFVSSALALHQGYDLAETLRTAIVSSPLIFFGTIMVLEPSTISPRRSTRLVYAALVGGLSVSQIHASSIYATPELALVIGNLFSFAISPKYRLALRLHEKRQLSEHVYDFSFTPDRPITHLAGQYMEFTLNTPLDDRGNRRTFTIASSPNEPDIHIGVKFYEPSSTFKQTLRALEPGDTILAGQIAGDFTLPKDLSQKLVFIAGGIGITPFRSMIQYLHDTEERRDITIFYVVSSPTELSYLDTLEQPMTSNVRIVKILTSSEAPADWHGYRGMLTRDIIEQETPAYLDCAFYLSGPNAMVQNYKDQLRQMGVSRRHIKTDYFSGY
jgi:ferredoxin-NADP reductase